MTTQLEQELKKTLIMQPQEFRDLYIEQKQDLGVTTFQDVAGFSVVKEYPENTKFFKDGNLMFIRVYLRDGFVCGGIEMVDGKGHDNGIYYLVDVNKYKNKVTGFSFFEEEDIIFDPIAKKVHIGKQKRNLSLNEFIDVLVKNHLQDKLFFKRKINFLAQVLVMFVFWLSDQKYDDVRIFVNIDNSQLQNQNKIKKDAEPFFKYFYISKNILFTLSTFVILLLFFFQHYNIIKSKLFVVSNPIFIFAFFLFLFISEKITVFLGEKIEEFIGKDKKENFISRLHLYRYKNSFKLKF